ncbi:hypothetical protein D3C76_1446850 [compost metagenome]
MRHVDLAVCIFQRISREFRIFIHLFCTDQSPVRDMPRSKGNTALAIGVECGNIIKRAGSELRVDNAILEPIRHGTQHFLRFFCCGTIHDFAVFTIHPILREGSLG